MWITALTHLLMRPRQDSYVSGSTRFAARFALTSNGFYLLPRCELNFR